MGLQLVSAAELQGLQLPCKLPLQEGLHLLHVLAHHFGEAGRKEVIDVERYQIAQRHLTEQTRTDSCAHG